MLIAWIVDRAQLADKAQIGMPEVGLRRRPECLATGAFKNRAPVAVSTGLLQGWDEIEAVIGHEVAHIANGDMYHDG
jgi:heat shock protein HtpX